jgi:hypothetical protein
MLVKLVQLKNILLLIIVNELLVGKLMLVKPELWNAEPSMVVTLFGIEMLSNLEQSWNAEMPINVTLIGIEMLAKLVQL